MVDQKEDAEVKQEQYEELLNSLTLEERDACEYLSITDWQTGADLELLHGAYGISELTIDSLMKKEILESKPGWEFFQEGADQLQGEIDAIEQRRRPDIQNFSLSDLESDLLNNYDLYKRVADRKNPTLRCRFKDPNFQEYVKSQMEEGEPTE